MKAGRNLLIWKAEHCASERESIINRGISLYPHTHTSLQCHHMKNDRNIFTESWIEIVQKRESGSKREGRKAVHEESQFIANPFVSRAHLHTQELGSSSLCRTHGDLSTLNAILAWEKVCVFVHVRRWGRMYCTCSNQWILNDRNLSSSTAILPRKSYEAFASKNPPAVKTTPVTAKKSALKSTTTNRTNVVTPKKSVKTIDSRLGPRFYSLPRSRSKQRPHVSTIFSSDRSHQRRQSEVLPWHLPQQQQQKQSIASQCTCRSSCYFCNLNYPKFPQLSASTNALGYYYHPHYSTLSLNNPNYCQQTSTAPSNQYLFSQSYQLPSSAFNINSNHHHSMINLNYHNEHTQNCEPLLLNENSSSPTMSNSPVPDPPAPPLNPNCARCRFTSTYPTCTSSTAVVVAHPPNITASNGTLHRQATTTSVGSNPNMNYGASSAGTVAPVNAFTGMWILSFWWWLWWCRSNFASYENGKQERRKKEKIYPCLAFLHENELMRASERVGVRCKKKPFALKIAIS